MTAIVLIIFVGVFAMAALVVLASGAGTTGKTKQVLARLDSALATDHAASSDVLVDLRKKEMLSAIPLVHRWLLNIKLAPRLHTMLYQANLKWTAGGLILMCLTLFLLPGNIVYLKTQSLLLSLAIGAAMGFMPIGYVLFRRRQRFGKFEKLLPEALEMMVSALRVGHSLNAAIGLVTREGEEPVRSEFKICFDEQNYGLEMRTAMGNLVERVPLQDLKIVTTAILIQKESGGNLAEILDKTAKIIRERFRLKREVATHTAQGRLTGWILALMPVILGVLLYTVNPENMSLLWTRPIGLKLIYASSAMTVVGTLLIRKIVNLDV